MRQRFASFIVSLMVLLRVWWRHVQGHPKSWTAAALLAILVPVTLVTAAYAMVEPSEAYILDRSNPAAIQAKDIKVGVVFGSGITRDGKPFPNLRSRLDTAAEALQKGEVQKLLLTGDNRFDGYDEPGAMMNYLESVKHVSASKLQPDYAGRSTYESCERASKVFGLQTAVLFSAKSHLLRAIYLCRQFGIQAYGVASDVEGDNAQRREAMARVKAVLNVYVKGERTILGPAISL